jgi:hypothetical protein
MSENDQGGSVYAPIPLMNLAAMQVGLQQLADIVAAYYNRLVECGVKPEHATLLTAGLQQSIVTPKRFPADE